jgi:hypothetical protein
MPTRPTVFLSYSHKDRKWLGELRTMLAPLVRDSLIDVWWDGDIEPSERWREEIDKALASARIGVLLVSPNFLASDFISQNELPYLIEAARKRSVALFWVLLAECHHEYTPLAEIQPAHDISRPIRTLRPAERAAVLDARTPRSQTRLHRPQRQIAISTHILPPPMERPWRAMAVRIAPWPAKIPCGPP